MLQVGVEHTLGLNLGIREWFQYGFQNSKREVGEIGLATWKMCFMASPAFQMPMLNIGMENASQVLG